MGGVTFQKRNFSNVPQVPAWLTAFGRAINLLERVARVNFPGWRLDLRSQLLLWNFSPQGARRSDELNDLFLQTQ